MKYFQLSVLITIFFDQLTKTLSLRNIDQTSVNSGVSFAWNLPGTLGGMRLELFAAGLSLLIAVLYWAYKKTWLESPVFSGLFFGGAISNIIDRFFFQGVTDWLKIPFLNLTNNLADWAILIGGVGLVLGLVKAKPTND